MTQAIDKNGLEAAYDVFADGYPVVYSATAMEALEAAIAAYLSASPQPQAHEAEPSPAAQPVARWDGWRPVATAPEDEGVILCTSGGHVGEALMLRDEDTGEQKWTWASGPVSKFHAPLGWQPLPSAIDKPVADLGAAGFDGPTGAE